MDTKAVSHKVLFLAQSLDFPHPFHLSEDTLARVTVSNWALYHSTSLG